MELLTLPVRPISPFIQSYTTQGDYADTGELVFREGG